MKEIYFVRYHCKEREVKIVEKKVRLGDHKNIDNLIIDLKLFFIESKVCCNRSWQASRFLQYWVKIVLYQILRETMWNTKLSVFFSNEVLEFLVQVISIFSKVINWTIYFFTSFWFFSPFFSSVVVPTIFARMNYATHLLLYILKMKEYNAYV